MQAPQHTAQVHHPLRPTPHRQRLPAMVMVVHRPLHLPTVPRVCATVWQACPSTAWRCPALPRMLTHPPLPLHGHLPGRMTAAAATRLPRCGRPWCHCCDCQAACPNLRAGLFWSASERVCCFGHHCTSWDLQTSSLCHERYLLADVLHADVMEPDGAVHRHRHPSQPLTGKGMAHSSVRC